MHGHPPRARARGASPTACATTSSTGWPGSWSGNPAHERRADGTRGHGRTARRRARRHLGPGPRRPPRVRHGRGGGGGRAPGQGLLRLAGAHRARGRRRRARRCTGARSSARWPRSCPTPAGPTRPRRSWPAATAASSRRSTPRTRRFTADVVLGLAPYHGRVFLGSAKIAEQSPGPGTVLPQLVHGGPGPRRAAARSWAACAGSRSTCSAWPWKARARSSRRSPDPPDLGRLAALGPLPANGPAACGAARRGRLPTGSGCGLELDGDQLLDLGEISRTLDEHAHGASLGVRPRLPNRRMEALRHLSTQGRLDCTPAKEHGDSQGRGVRPGIEERALPRADLQDPRRIPGVLSPLGDGSVASRDQGLKRPIRVTEQPRQLRFGRRACRWRTSSPSLVLPSLHTPSTA